MTAISRIGMALVCVACIAGCAMEGSRPPTAAVTSVRARAAPPEGLNAVVPGRSTKGDVIAALGETLAISFDTGYEVWVYRLANTQTGEFVVLFTPAGVVAKTRIRPEPARQRG